MKVDVVQIQSLTAERLWSDYVSRRKPVLIEGHPDDASWKASEKWTVEYLKKAEMCDVVVEERKEGENFGRGRKKRMSFGEFLEAVEAGNDRLYLSAQEAEIGPDGFPALLSPPLTALKDDICLRPNLLGHLVPQRLNIWMGYAQKGACSGLHHDYHDNLYVLFEGSKHFLLFPPSKAGVMYTQGCIKHVHDNGRIVYQGQGAVNADGSDPMDVARWEKQQGRGDKASTSESELEDILDRIDEERDDYVPSEEDLSVSNASQEDEEIVPRRKRQRNSQCTQIHGEPPNFSRVDLTIPWEKQKDIYPNFPKLSEAVECLLTKGQMLYLPTGWFHNVTSLGSKDGSGLHLALNYWCHPPDHLPTDDDRETAFDRPYRRDYWNRLWEAKVIAEQTNTVATDNRQKE